MVRTGLLMTAVFGLLPNPVFAGGFDGGSTGHGPIRRNFVGALQTIRVQLRSRPECEKYFPGGGGYPEELSNVSQLTQDAYFEDGSSIIAGVFTPSTSGNVAADVACAIAASAGPSMPSLGECEIFVGCLGL